MARRLLDDLGSEGRVGAGPHSIAGGCVITSYSIHYTKLYEKVTLWVFIGIEGAVVVSARARRRQDVGRATLIALLGALALYVMVSLFALGVMSQPEVAALKNPSTAAILAQIVGPWGAWLINIGMVISVLGAFLSVITSYSIHYTKLYDSSMGAETYRQ